jgi:integrase
MVIKWVKTAHRGLRYYDHPERKHGKKRDRYYAIRFKVDDKEHGYGIGWLSDGVPDEVRKEHHNIGFEEYCLMLLRQYKGNIKAGSGPQSPKEKRKIEKTKREQEEAETERLERDAMTLGQIFTDQYMPIALQNKTRASLAAESSLFRLWIEPVIGKLSLRTISPLHIERIKKNMASASKSPRYIHYALAIIRQVFNFSKVMLAYEGVCPITKVKIPKYDNQRQRFLTHEEAERLLNALKIRSIDVYHMALLSLNCGLRAGEVFSLQWADVDIQRGIITLRNTKNGETRHSMMTDVVKAMFTERKPGDRDALVFPSTRGTLITGVSKTFELVVDELLLNEGITDARYRIVWHSLRHTHASWLVQGGVSLYVVQKMLGHSRISQTERYSHLHQDTITDAVKVFEAAWQKNADSGKVINLSK